MMPPARLTMLAETADRLAKTVPPLESLKGGVAKNPWSSDVCGLWHCCFGAKQDSPMEPTLKGVLLPGEMPRVHGHLFNLMWNAVTHGNSHEHAHAAEKLGELAMLFRTVAAREEARLAETKGAEAVTLFRTVAAREEARLAETKGAEAVAKRPDAEPDRFEMIEWIGDGAYGEVWRACDQKLRRPVAIKFFRSGLDAQDALAHARAVARVTHPSIVIVYDVTDVPDPGTGAPVPAPATVMELVEGSTLHHRLRRAISLDQTRAITTALLDAVAAYRAHGLAHLDLHGGNVIVGDRVVKVLDASCSAGGFSRSTATREEQQRRDLRDVRDLLVEVLQRSPVPLEGTRRFADATFGASLETMREELERVLPVPKVRRINAAADDIRIVAAAGGQCDERRDCCDDSGAVFQVDVDRTGARRYVCNACYTEMVAEGLWRRVE